MSNGNVTVTMADGTYNVLKSGYGSPGIGGGGNHIGEGITIINSNVTAVSDYGCGIGNASG